MITYIFVNFVIIFGGIIYEARGEREIKLKNNISNNYMIFLIPTFVLLFIVSAFRGEFTSDYKNYSTLFHIYNQFSFFDIFQKDLYQEKGYIILNKLIGSFTSNPLYLFVIISFFIIFIFLKEFKNYSKYIWLSVLMFVTIGSFYTSFNIMRHILAVAIVFSGSKFLYDRNLLKYSLIVLIAATFHKTALIMLIFYFILNYKFSAKKILLVILSSVFFMQYLSNILAFIQRFFYTVYTTDSYGMSGLKFTNVILPVFLLAFILSHLNKLSRTDTKVNVWVNAAVFYAFFSILGLKVQLLQRLGEFFSPYILLIFPLLISQIYNKRLRAIYIFFSVAIFVLYNYLTLSGTGYDPYYFIWTKK